MNKKNTPRPTVSVPARHPATTWIINSCCWFTAMCLFLLILNATVWSTNGIPPLRYLLLFPLGLCLSAAGTVRRSKLSKGARYTLHPLFSVGGFYLCGFLPYQIQSNARASTALIMVVLTLIVYGLIVGITALVLRKKNTKSANTQAYQSRFKGEHE